MISLGRLQIKLNQTKLNKILVFSERREIIKIDFPFIKCLVPFFFVKEKPDFEPELPWKEKPMKVNSVIDVHVSTVDSEFVSLR